MAFVSVAHLCAGMMLEKDLYFYDDKQMEVITTRAGQVLTKEIIERLLDEGISGAYVNKVKEKPFDPLSVLIKSSPITKEVKLEAVDNVKAAFSMLTDPHIDAEKTIHTTEHIANELVQILLEEKETLVNLADLRIFDDCTYNHSLGVSIIAVAIGSELKLGRQDLINIGIASLLHDIGKMKIPIEIIDKPGPLTNEEFEQIKLHPNIGADFLKEQGLVPKEIYSAVRAHHERFDGTGYPYHLAGKNIPLYSRIISIADVYDALTAKRPYRLPAKVQEVVEYIMGGCGTFFDFDIVQAFLRRISPFPVGSCVLLSNRKLAIVTKANPSNPLRPFIRILDHLEDEIDLLTRMDAQTLVVLDVCRLTLQDVMKKEPKKEAAPSDAEADEETAPQEEETDEKLPEKEKIADIPDNDLPEIPEEALVLKNLRF